MLKNIKKSHKIEKKLRDLNNKIHHKLYIIFKHLSNMYKHLKIGNILALLIIIIFILQCIYHLSLNGFSMWYLAEVIGLGALYISLAYFIKEGV